MRIIKVTDEQWMTLMTAVLMRVDESATYPAGKERNIKYREVLEILERCEKVED
jgi:hypothetical protein